jgi:hypothetical protein
VAYGYVTRSLAIGAGPVRFTSTCTSGCAGQVLEILNASGAIVARGFGSATTTLNATLAAGTYTFRITTSSGTTVSYSITYTS